MGVIRFGRTLPLLLIVIGLVKIFESTAGPGPSAVRRKGEYRNPEENPAW